MEKLNIYICTWVTEQCYGSQLAKCKAKDEDDARRIFKKRIYDDAVLCDIYCLDKIEEHI